jgi:Putative transposase DNA-binding domain
MKDLIRQVCCRQSNINKLNSVIPTGVEKTGFKDRDAHNFNGYWKAEMKQRQHQSSGQSKQHKLTKAVTHIMLGEINSGKLATLDELAQVYLALCQQYITLFCTDEHPDKFRAPCFSAALSERWHRVAIQQAAGIAQSWRSNRAQAYQDYQDALAEYGEQRIGPVSDSDAREPEWREWGIPTLKQTCIQANVNVVVLELSQDSTFDYWLRISTLEKGKPIKVPVKLADYHRKALEGKAINTSTTLNKRGDGWWLTLTYDEIISIQTEATAPVIGVDVGIANFLTTSDGKHYGTFHGKLRERQKRDREKRRRKAKLRACLEKKGVEKLPSTSSKSGRRLARHVRQEINRAVNVCLDEHPEAQIAYEQLSVASMKYKARAMNAYLRASNLAHIPRKIAWEASKRGMEAICVKSAYSSQECSMCHYPDRANRPDQQTFCCVVCGFSTHADHNAAMNLARRSGDRELHACQDRQEIKALLLKRHKQWRTQKGWS